jgi:guanosine-3',5'-bis(diphosphate) 3'-pyrophosphohydrolase
MSSLDAATRAVLDAVSFAARAHHGQLRKDGRTPYVSHVYRVAFVTRHVFGIDDAAVLTAAVLHDTVEDTTTDFDDIEERFGAEIARWVGALSKDKRMQDEPREEAYCASLRAAPWQVKACKLGDLCDNLLDSKHLTPDKRPRTLARSRRYLTALDTPDLPPPVRRALGIVAELLAEMELGKS